MRNTKQFFAAFEKTLKYRLPPDEFNQVMDESLWEFESSQMSREGGNTKDSESLIRLSSICVAFYRAMTRVGIDPKTALDSMDSASDNLDWSPVAQTHPDKCSLAAYFRSKNALEVCEVTFCKTCPHFENGCAAIQPRLFGIRNPH